MYSKVAWRSPVWWRAWRAESLLVWIGVWGPPVAAISWLLFFYAYCLRVWIGLGHLPNSIAEHAGLNGSWHHRASWDLLGVLAWTTMFWSLGIVLGVAGSRRLRHWSVLTALLVPWAVWAYLNWLDPGDWFDWFLD
jgi:hypothetical protein